MSDKKGADAAKKESKQEKRKRVASEIDDLFAALPKREEKKPDAAEEAAAEARADEDAEAAKEEAKKRRKEKEHYLSNGEKLQEQSAPRRFEEGLPVFKSFEDFSDLKADQRPVVRKGKPGKCPFDCWCCY